MIITGKCPKCGQILQNANMEKIRAGEIFNYRFPAVSFVCPAPGCQTVLGVALDPNFMAAIVAEEVEKKLKGRR
jgi:hypothetical protein